MKKRYCKNCGKELKRAMYKNAPEGYNRYSKRSYCDRKCYLATTRVAYCKTCGDKLSYWNEKFCSRECYGKSKIVQDKETRDINKGRKEARKLAKKHLNIEDCELCGSNRFIEIHHIDKNPTNNELSNLQVLCKKCHNLIHFPSKKITCKICGKPHHARGYCDSHYRRFMRTGNPLNKRERLSK